MKRLLCLTLVLVATSAVAATNYCGPALATLQSYVDAASSGDTIMVTNGSVTWTNTLTIDKNLNLIGAGTNATHITVATSYFLVGVGSPTVTAFRISGFDFNGNQSGGGGIYLAGTNASFAGVNPSGDYYNAPILAGRVDHCLFREFTVSGDNCAMFISGRVWGVVDHNVFLNCQKTFEFFGAIQNASYANGTWDWAYIPPDNAARGLGLVHHYLGSTNNLVIEDNYIAATHDFGVASAIEGGNNTSHFVFRHNTVYDHSSAWGQLLEMHGNNYSCSGYSQGMVCAEIYNNVFDTQAYQGWLQRGGTCMYYSNTFYTTQSSLDLNEDEISDGGYSGSGCAGALDANVYPHMQQVTNSHYWANYFGATLMTPVNFQGTVSGGTPLGNYFQEGRDYWLHAPNSTNVLKDYLSLAYPHPLVSAQDGTNSTPATPTNLRAAGVRAILTSGM